MSKTYSAGIVTAYGAAKRAGYQGTYEDFCRQQAGYAGNAAAVEAAKTAAQTAANTASTKASEATTAATAAQTAKTQTEQAASQALTDIETARSGAISAVQTVGQTQTANARSQAQAAAQSATTASTKADEASASATSAGQSAANAAASATSAAQSASNAQDVLDSIPADYSDLSANVSQLKADLGDVENEIYSGSTVAFDWTALGTTTYPYNFRPGYINGSNGNVGSNSTTTKQYLRNNKAIQFSGDTVTITPPSGYYVSSIAEYTSNVISSDNFVGMIYTGSSVDTPVTFTNIPDHYFAIVFGLFTDNSTNYYQNITFLSTILAVQNSTISRIDKCDAVVPFVHPLVRVSKMDSSADFDTISDAIAYANNNPYTTILVDSGEYDIIEEFGGSTYTENLSGLSSYAGGLMLGNDTTIMGMGSGAKLTANYTAGANQVMTDRFSIFNIVGSFRLENIEMEVTNVRYCVHEDMGALDSSLRPDFYTGEYINCKMLHNGTISNTFNVASCIGGGTMNKSHHIVDGCYLESPSGKNPIGYHNNYSSNGGVARVQMRNCYLANNGTLTLTVHNNNTQIIIAEICGNRLGGNNIDRSNGLYDVKAWNNVVE